MAPLCPTVTFTSVLPRGGRCALLFSGRIPGCISPCPLAEELLQCPQGWRVSLLLDHHSPSAQWMSWAFPCLTVVVVVLILSLVIGFCLRNLILKVSDLLSCSLLSQTHRFQEFPGSSLLGSQCRNQACPALPLTHSLARDEVQMARAFLLFRTHFAVPYFWLG